MSSEPKNSTADHTNGESKELPTTSVAPGAVIPAMITVPSSALQQLWAVAEPLTSTLHPEIWGVTLSNPSAHVPSQIVFQKYLNANDQDVAKATEQLTKTLEWRKSIKPLELMEKKFSKAKFGGLGFVTVYEEKESAVLTKKEIFTWNIYGSVQNIDETFGDLEQFISWRVALMELALSILSLSTATVPVPANPDQDPYKITQVHDYKSISFLRQSPAVKSASQETIKVFAQNYPELLKEKFFVNVPAFMGFVYEIIKRFVAERTRRKFHPMSNGKALAKEFSNSDVKALGDMLPAEYGGKGEELVKVGKELMLE